MFILCFSLHDVLFQVEKCVGKVVLNVIPKKFLKEERLYFGEDVDAALLADECFELWVVPSFVSFLIH